MPSAERTHSGDRRDDILKVAAKLFAEHGFDQATMRKIGKETGIQPASLYYHFTTKEDILDEIVRTFLSGLPAKYNAIIARTEIPERSSRFHGAGFSHLAEEPRGHVDPHP